MYILSKDDKYLELTKKLYQYFIDHLLPTNLPPWDFSCTNQVFCPYDSSAASIALSAIVDLYHITNDEEYFIKANQIKDALMLHCNGLDIERWESILLHGCIGPAYQKGREKVIIKPEIDVPLIYADYYFLEALLKLNGNYNFKL